MTHYITVIAVHDDDVWHTTSVLEVGRQPDDVIDAAITTTVDKDREALASLIPNQLLPAVEWYARIDQSPPPPITASESPRLSP